MRPTFEMLEPLISLSSDEDKKRMLKLIEKQLKSNKKPKKQISEYMKKYAIKNQIKKLGQ